jgi:CRP-like cAMP-binding protein
MDENYPIDTLVDRLKGVGPMSETLAEKIRAVAKVKAYKKGEFILTEGQICDKASMIVKGFVRFYYVIDGRDITSRLLEEGFIISSWLSYYKQIPSNEFIEAAEDTILVGIDYRDIQRIYNEIPESNVIGRRETEHAFYLSELRTQMLRKRTAEEKYRYFLDNHPTLLQRVPLKHIASYLGMNEETLSRVRSKYHKKNS